VKIVATCLTPLSGLKAHEILTTTRCANCKERAER
jgi:hypothetical protein